MARIRIGVSGWRYTPWRGVFYPRDLPQRLELRYASHIFPSLEINGSSYGDKELYKSGYSSKALDRWAERIRAWSRSRDVYCYFDNTDVKLRAPVDAQTLMRKLGLPRGSGFSLTASRRAVADHRMCDAHRPP